MLKPVFVIDIGNTHIVTGVYTGNDLLFTWRVSTDKSRTEDEYFTIFQQLLEQHNQPVNEFELCVMSSVVPTLTRVFSHMIEKYFQIRLLHVTPHSAIGLRYPMPDPGHLGADLVVNGYAAWKKYKKSCIICDFGTATTIQLVDADGYFHGTAIMPGVVSSSKSLVENAAQLSAIQLKKPQGILGTTTKDALLSGIINSHAWAVDSFIRKIRAEYSELGTIKAVATGGITPMICELIESIDIVDPTLTLDGLNLIGQSGINE
ncbi:MAG: type III pantothenate kinase [Candidatus Cloacimonetes bacterium]|nr:type III pantothenate kinase [Candidatus Cloacimonadota bacterium]